MIAPMYSDNRYYVLDKDFSEYTTEMSIQSLDEVWVLLEDYLKEECE